MAKSIYSTPSDAVDAVFFAVVPDTFMRGENGFGGAPVRRRTGPDVQQQELDCPLLSPHDPWSF